MKHLLVYLLLAFLLSSCKRDDMADQPRYKPGAASKFFPDGKAGRPIPLGTVSTDGKISEPESFQGVQWAMRDNLPVPITANYPFPITKTDLLRGQEQFTIYCTPCHGILGDGNGMIVQRGFTRPPTYHQDRLRNAAPGYFYNVITNGIGAMYSYNDRVAPDDRWRIAAYIRALQFARNAPARSQPAEAQQKAGYP